MRTWPHAPCKVVNGDGPIIITAATYQKEPLFVGEERLALLQNTLLDVLEECQWEPMAWAIFPNHYHLVANTSGRVDTVEAFARKLHGRTAIQLNKLDQTPGRKVWYRYWDTWLTFEKSLLARMAYVHFNPVKHGLVSQPEDYAFSSARWFLSRGDRPFVESVLSFKIDSVNVLDDF